MKSLLTWLARWFDNHAVPEESDSADEHRVDWVRIVPFAVLHLGCLGVFRVGWSWPAVWVAIGLYLVRMFAVTGFYHRYFSHQTFKTSRAWQFVFAVLGNSAAQRGPLWWAAHHRHHHRHSDTDRDRHSPHRHGIAWSHMGWFTTRANFRSDLKMVPEFARYPELRFLDRFDIVVPIALALLLYWIGGAQMLVWGFFISTVAVFHATSFINSLAHVLGSRRYDTGDESRNSLLLAILTLGEGWHNNHHHYPAAARQGFRWWEIDVTFYGLWLLERLRVIRELKPVPAWVR